MDRRVFVGSLAGALLARPFRAAAQGVSGVPRIGLLRPGTPSDVADRASVGAFLNGLQEAGYTPGADVRVEIRYAEGKLERLKAIARDLVALPAHVLVTSNPYATEAARDATHTVPIVVALDYETDPVARGWIASIARPQGNLTGLFLDQPEMTGKLVTAFRAMNGGPAAAAAEVPAAADPLAALSPRVQEILRHIARGASNKEIARGLDIAETSVKIHVQHILRKLDLSNRVHAAVYATERGLLA